jgi:hypothetical protein
VKLTNAEVKNAWSDTPAPGCGSRSRGGKLCAQIDLVEEGEEVGVGWRCSGGRVAVDIAVGWEGVQAARKGATRKQDKGVGWGCCKVREYSRGMKKWQGG